MPSFLQLSAIPLALKNEKVLKTQLMQFSLISAARHQNVNASVRDRQIDKAHSSAKTAGGMVAQSCGLQCRVSLMNAAAAFIKETRTVCHPIRSSASSELPKTSSRMIRSVASFKYSSNTFSI